MRTNFRRLILDTLIYGGGDFLLRATAFLTMPIYTNIFTPEDYGIWGYVGTLTTLFVTIVGFGGANVSNRFFFDAKQTQEKQLVVSTWFGFIVLWTSALALLLLPFADIFSRWSFQSNNHHLLFSLSLLAVPITLFNTLSGQLLRDQFQAKLSSALNIAATLITILVTLLLVVVFNFGLVGLAWGNLLAALLMLPPRVWTARHFIRPRFAPQLLRRMLIFGAPLVPMAIAYWIFNISDTILLGKLSDFEQVGLYSVAVKLTLPLMLINSALGQAWIPHALNLYENQPAVARIFYGQMLNYVLICFGLLGIGVITFSSELLVILTAPAFYGAAVAIPPLILADIALASTQVTALSISLTQKTYYLTIFSALAALLNAALNFLLIPQWGMVAAGWTTALAYLFLTIAYFIVSQRLLPIVFETPKIVAIIGLTLAFGVGAVFLNSVNTLMLLPVKFIYCLSYVLALFLFQVVGQREWRAVDQVKQTILAKMSGAV